MHYFYAGSKRRPDSVIVAGRIDLAAGHEMHDVGDLMDYVYRSMKMTPEQFDALVDSGAIETNRVPVGTYHAFETSIPAPVPGEPHTRTLTLPAGDFLIVLVHMNMDEMAASSASTWRYLVGSLKVDPSSGAFAHSALVYGGVALALLLLLVVFTRMASRARRRAALAGGPGIRVMDDYPDGPGTYASAGPSQPAATPRTLPSSPVPDGLAPARRPAAGAPTDTVPEVPHVRPQTPASAPAAAPAPAQVPDAPAPSGRLLPTLPPSGRWET